MKKIAFKLLGIILVSSIIWGCQKLENLQVFGSGIKITYTLSSNNIQPKVYDSGRNVLNVTWQNPGYATASSNIKYTIQIDSVNGTFARPVFQKSFIGVIHGELIGRELNNAALNLGYKFYQTVNLRIRIVTSYANNNEQIENDPQTFSYTIYPVPAVKLPPSNRVWLVGSGTPIGWNNTVNNPDSLSLVRSTTDTFVYSAQVTLVGKGEYVLIPVKGSWDNKYTVRDKTIIDLYKGGIFGYNFSDNIPGPPADGVYELTFNFLSGTFGTKLIRAFAPAVQVPLADELYIVGSATVGGWANPVPVPLQKFTKVSNTLYEITLKLNANGDFLLLPNNGNWGLKYARVNGNASAGNFNYFTTGGDNFQGPSTAGIYKISVNFQTGTYSTTLVTPSLPIPDSIYITGSATPGGWVNNPPANQKFKKISATAFELILNFVANGEYTILPNFGSWDFKYALNTGTAQSGTLQYNTGGNIPGPANAGTYKLTVDFGNGSYNLTTYSVPLPEKNQLFIVGSATPGGWNNPVPVPLQQLSMVNTSLYQTNIKFSAGGEYLLLPINGDWGKKYGVANKNLAGLSDGGNFGFNTAANDFNDNFPGPATAGIYKLEVDFITGTFSVEPVTPALQVPDSIYITGSATPGGWVNNPPANQKFTKVNATKFELVLNFNAAGEYTLLPAYGSWDSKYALDKTNTYDNWSGKLLYNNGDNIPGPKDAGMYKLTVDFETGKYTLLKL